MDRYTHCGLSTQQDHHTLNQEVFCAVAGLGLKGIVQGEQTSHAGQICGSPYRSPQNSQIHEHRGDRRKKLVFIGMVCASVTYLETTIKP